MNNLARTTDIYLNPGEYYFSDQKTLIHTLLGSCVSMTIWHPQSKVGGMCHYLSPFRRKSKINSSDINKLDGRYAVEAITFLLREMDKLGVPLHECQAKLFGGGDMFPTTSAFQSINVGQRNIAIARTLVKIHGLYCLAEHTGGIGYRNIIFDVGSGDVLIRHQEVLILNVSEACNA